MIDVENAINDYFVRPIFERTGYNAVNTLAYAAIAIFALYAIWRLMKKYGVDFSSRDFLLSVGAFVLLGSTARVLTDLSDSGALAASAQGAFGGTYSALFASRIFEYGYLTVTPGIYIITAILFLSSLAIGKMVGNPRFAAYAGLALWAPCFLLLVPFMSNFAFAFIAIILAIAGSILSYSLMGKLVKRPLEVHEKLAIFGQALDGAATFAVIDLFSKQTGQRYFEQHVLSAGIGSATPLGFGLFFLIKLALASAIVYFLSKEGMNGKDKAFVLIAIAVMGFAPGIRDLLRMLCGT